MGNLSGFNADNVDGSFGSYDPVPAGKYPAVLESTEFKTARANPNNRFIQFVWTLTDGDYAGRKIYDVVMRQADNDMSVQIGNQKLKAIVSIFGPANDTSEWHDRELILQIGINKAGDRNEVKGFQGAGPQSRPQPASPPGGKPPQPKARW